MPLHQPVQKSALAFPFLKLFPRFLRQLIVKLIEVVASGRGIRDVAKMRFEGEQVMNVACHPLGECSWR